MQVIWASTNNVSNLCYRNASNLKLICAIEYNANNLCKNSMQVTCDIDCNEKIIA